MKNKKKMLFKKALGSKAARKRYADAARERRAGAEKRLRRLGLDQAQVRTGEPYIHELVELFRRREQRR